MKFRGQILKWKFLNFNCEKTINKHNLLPMDGFPLGFSSSIFFFFFRNSNFQIHEEDFTLMRSHLLIISSVALESWRLERQRWEEMVWESLSCWKMGVPKWKKMVREGSLVQQQRRRTNLNMMKKKPMTMLLLSSKKPLEMSLIR